MLLHQFLALAAIATPYASAQAIFPSSSSSTLTLITIPTPTPSSTVAVASATASGPASLFLVQPGTFIACATNVIEWRLRNVDPASYTVTFRAHNSGVAQSSTATISAIPTSSSIPITSSVAAVTTAPSSSRAVALVIPSSSSSVGLTQFIRDVPSQLLLKRSSLNINQTLGTNPASFAYALPIILPQGRYMLVATVPELDIEESAPFTVVESATNTTCLTAFAALSLATSQSSTRVPSSTVSASSSKSASSGAAVNTGTASAAGNGISVGAIVGAVIGGLAVLAIIGLVVFCCIKRKKRRATRETNGRWESETAFRGGAGPATYISKPQRLSSSGQTSPPSSQSSHDLNYLNSQPQIPSQAVVSDDQNPFTTPPITTATDRYSKRRSTPLSPPARPESEVDPTARRNSVPPGSFDQSVFAGGGAALARKPSAKRKAVPSLGPELRKEMAKTGSSGGGNGGKKEFKLIPDMPGALAGSR